VKAILLNRIIPQINLHRVLHRVSKTTQFWPVFEIAYFTYFSEIKTSLFTFFWNGVSKNLPKSLAKVQSINDKPWWFYFGDTLLYGYLMYIVPLNHCSQNLTLPNVLIRCLLPGNRVTAASATIWGLNGQDHGSGLGQTVSFSVVNEVTRLPGSKQEWKRWACQILTAIRNKGISEIRPSGFIINISKQVHGQLAFETKILAMG